MDEEGNKIKLLCYVLSFNKVQAYKGFGFSDCEFIVFDEVISTLDIETAYDIEKMILDYKDKTIVFISHNFSGLLMREYDEIIYMGDGKIIAHGHYDQLIENVHFKRLLKIKFGDLVAD